jgi:hypothetical protein
MVRIHHKSTARELAPLRRVLERTAQQTGETPEEAERLARIFFEHVVECMAAGRAVRIPGFGAFGFAVNKRSITRRWPRRRYRPLFIPARPFGNQIEAAMTPRDILTQRPIRSSSGE